MGMVSADQLSDGMVLARPVVSPQGQLLAVDQAALMRGLGGDQSRGEAA